MPQQRFKFKLCRLASGERRLDSLPIIQLLLPSRSISLSCSFCSLCLLFISREVVSPGLKRQLLSFTSFLPPWKFSRKSLALFSLFLYIYVPKYFPFYFLLSTFELPLILLQFSQISSFHRFFWRTWVLWASGSSVWHETVLLPISRPLVSLVSLFSLTHTHIFLFLVL